MKNKKLAGSLLLLLTALIWGCAFVSQRIGMSYVQPFTFNSIRTFIGGLFLIPLPSSLPCHQPAAGGNTIYQRRESRIHHFTVYSPGPMSGAFHRTACRKSCLGGSGPGCRRSLPSVHGGAPGAGEGRLLYHSLCPYLCLPYPGSRLLCHTHRRHQAILPPVPYIRRCRNGFHVHIRDTSCQRYTGMHVPYTLCRNLLLRTGLYIPDNRAEAC